MTNQLLKNVKATYTPGSPGIVASPGYPARNAYTSWAYATVCKYRDVVYTWAQDPDGTWRHIPIYPTSGVVGPYECKRQLVPTYYPYDPGVAPTPGQPAGAYQVTYDFNLGWNAGAGSVRYFDRHGIARFTVNPGTIGSVTGLARENARRGIYQDIEHGFYVTHGIARIYEKGIEIAYVGAVASGTELSISRMNNVVRYAIGASVVHQSALQSTGRVFLTAALYAGGDYVDTPVINNVMMFEALELSAKENTTTEASPYTRGVTERLTLTDEYVGTKPSTGSMSFLPLAMNAGVAGRINGAVMSFEELTVSAEEAADLVPTYAIAAMSFAPLTLSALGSSIQTTAKVSTSVERGYITGAITVILSGAPGIVVSITFPSGEVRTGTIEDGLLTIVSSPNEPTTGSVVITMTLPNGSVQTQTITFNANGSITVSGTGAAPGAPIGGNFQSGSTTTTAAAAGTYTMTSSTNQPLGAFSVWYGVGGYMSFKPLEMMASQKTSGKYAQAVMSFLPLTVSASGLEGNTQAAMRELVVPTSTITFYGQIDVSMYSSITGSSTLATLTILDAAVQDTIEGTVTMTYSAIMQAVMEFEAQVFAGIPVYAEDAEVWVVNDETGASVAYESYDFNSFAQFRGASYGVKPDGVYLLEGDGDGASPIRSSVNFGKHDFGTSAKKSIPNCYIGASSSGDLYLQVTANGVTHTYQTNRNEDFLQAQRIKIGKGLIANYFTFELFNEVGADFELDSIEFTPAVLTRRVR